MAKQIFARHTVSIIFTLAVIWGANSWNWDPLLIAFGVLSVLLVAWICHRMDVIDHESQPFHLTLRLPAYYAWLIKQIVLSNIDVVKRVWRSDSSSSAVLARLPVEQSTDVGRVIYANSVNLTPGTLVVELSNTQMLVHALTQESITELQQGEMSRKVTELEG